MRFHAVLYQLMYNKTTHTKQNKTENPVVISKLTVSSLVSIQSTQEALLFP